MKPLLKEIGAEIRRRDPSGRGVNLIISQSSDTNLPFDVEQFKIKIDPPLKDLSLRQFLDAITLKAKPPEGAPAGTTLRYRVEDYAVVFSAASEASRRLVTRSFRVNPNTFQHFFNGVIYSRNPFQNLTTPPLRPATPPAAPDQSPISVTTTTNLNNVHEQVRQFFAAVGVDFGATNIVTGDVASIEVGKKMPAGKAIFFNERTGVLFARTTEEELNIIENAIRTLNVPPPQVTISVQIFDLPPEQAARIKTNYVVNRYMTATNEFIFASSTVTNPPSPLLPPTKTILDAVKNILIATNQTFASEFVLKPTIAAALIKELQSTEGVDALTSPNVTTLVGRQARVSLEETFTIVTAESLKSGGLPLPFGWTIDCTAETWDGLHLQLNTAAALTQFLGYEKAGETPLPRFQVRGTGSRVTLQPGHTQAFFLPAPTVNRVPFLADIPYLGRLFQSTENSRHLLILVTPFLTDPAGNVIHLPPE